MQVFFRAFNIFFGVVNVALFCFWLSLIRIEVTSVEKKDIWMLEQISFHVTILEVVFVLVGIIFAILGIFGFQILLERAESRADRSAREAVEQLYGEGQPLSGTESVDSALPGAGTPPKGGATREDKF